MRSVSLAFVGLLGYAAAATAIERGHHRETMEEAGKHAFPRARMSLANGLNTAMHARDLIAHRSDGIATFMSTFASNYSDPSLANLPIGGLEYFAASDTGDMYILALPISKQISNAEHAPLHNATISVQDEAAERKYGRFGATDRNRAVFFGSLQRIPKEDAVELQKAEKAFGKVHKDAKAYFPGKGPHFAYLSVFKVLTPLARSAFRILVRL